MTCARHGAQIGLPIDCFFQDRIYRIARAKNPAVTHLRRSIFCWNAWRLAPDMHEPDLKLFRAEELGKFRDDRKLCPWLGIVIDRNQYAPQMQVPGPFVEKSVRVGIQEQS